MRKLSSPHKPKGLERLAFRLPILLYRAHLGRLLGGRFMLINHIGRTSGESRQTVVEVVEHDAATDSYVAASGFGAHSDWYLNLQAHPQVTIQVGGRTIDVEAVQLTSEESGELMARYAVHYGTAAKKLCKFMGFEVDGSAEDYRAVGREIPFTRFVPRQVVRPEITVS